MAATTQSAPDELDLALIHALQIDARAPWSRVAAVLGVDTATVTRHWRSLEERRLAWVTMWPTPQRWAATSDVAIVLLEAGPDARDALIELPWVVGLDATSAGMMATITDARGLDGLGDRARAVADLGARVHRMDVVATISEEDSTWRLQALSREQQRALAPTFPAGAMRMPSAEAVADIAAELDDDPRLPALTLARRIGVSEATARRLVDRATATGLLRFGCDLAMPAAGLGRGAVLWGRAHDVEVAADRAARLPEAHRVGVVVGPAPLHVCVRARSLTALPRIERSWHDAASVDITERWTVLRTWKRNGHVLDAEGRSIRRIPTQW